MLFHPLLLFISLIKKKKKKGAKFSAGFAPNLGLREKGTKLAQNEFQSFSLDSQNMEELIFTSRPPLPHLSHSTF